MAAPVVESVNVQNFGGGSNVTFTKPTGTASGDLLVAFINATNNSGAPVAMTAPSDWTASTTSASVNVFGANSEEQLFWKEAGGSEPSTYAFTSSGNTSIGGTMLRISGADGTTPIGARSWSTGSAQTSPSVTTTLADSLLLSTFATALSGGGTQPSGYTSHSLDSTSTSFGVSSNTQASAGPSGTADWSNASFTAVAVHTVINPASGGSTVSGDGTATGTSTASAVGDPINPEYLRPDGTDSAGSWTTDTGATTNLHLAIDETTASDADFIQSEENPSTSVCRITLGNPTGNDPDTTATVALDYRFRKEGSATINMVVRLEEGTTTIASQTHNGVTTSWTAGTITLSTLEKNSVTNWDNMVLEVEATQV